MEVVFSRTSWRTSLEPLLMYNMGYLRFLPALYKFLVSSSFLFYFIFSPALVVAMYVTKKRLTQVILLVLRTQDYTLHQRVFLIELILGSHIEVNQSQINKREGDPDVFVFDSFDDGSMMSPSFVLALRMEVH